MNKERIVIDLPNGDSLVAEKCPHAVGQISVGIYHNEEWIQDLAVIETDDKCGEYVEDKFNIYVYGKEDDEEYTECFGVSRTRSDTL